MGPEPLFGPFRHGGGSGLLLIAFFSFFSGMLEFGKLSATSRVGHYRWRAGPWAGEVVTEAESGARW
jgi:hypothetical protein